VRTVAREQGGILDAELHASGFSTAQLGQHMDGASYTLVTEAGSRLRKEILQARY
jgi:hypothetical protein